MALDTDNIDDVLDAVRQAVLFRKKHTDMASESIQRYAGSRYRSDWTPRLNHEGFEYQWVTNMVPNLVYNNPQVNVQHQGLTSDNEMVRAMKDGLNAWIRAVNLVSHLQRIAVDVQFGFGVDVVTIEPTADYGPGDNLLFDEAATSAAERRRATEGGLVLPAVHRVSPHRFFCDPEGGEPYKWGFVGHIVIEDKDALLSARLPNGKPVYDRKAVESLCMDDGVTALLCEMGIYTSRTASQQSKKQVVLYEMFVPQEGLIYTFANTTRHTGSKGGLFLREPRKYRGPATGPYTLYGYSDVPDQVYPLPPLSATAEATSEINAHAQQLSDDAATAKRLLIIDSDPRVVQSIATAANASVLAIPAFKGIAQSLDIGGPNPANVQYVQYLRDRLARTSGVTDAVAGNVTGATAEEVHTAQANRNLRIQHFRRRFQDATARMLTIVASHLWSNPRVRLPIVTRDPRTGEQQAATFVGGVSDPKEQALFSGINIRIQPYSMELTDQAVLQKRAQQAMQIVLGVAPQMATMPEVRFDNLLDDMFQTLNIPGAAERYLNMDAVAAKAQAMQAQAMQQAPADGPSVGSGTIPANSETRTEAELAQDERASSVR